MADTYSEMDTDFRLCLIRKSSITAPEDLSNAQEITLTVGLWVVAKYDNDENPGEITSIDDDDIEVNVMARSARAWKWPTPEDRLFYDKKDILHIINPPNVASN